MSRVLLIGWDGADWRILDPMLEAGLLPNLRSLIDRGARGVLRSTTPNHSWAAWPSFLTGVEPSNHGVYDIFEKELGVRKNLPVTYRSIKEKTMLADLTAAGCTTVMTNLPLTFPPPRIDGKLVAGGVLPKWRPFTHPESLAGELEKAGAPFPINGMSWTTFRNRPEPFLQEARELTEARTRANLHLLDKYVAPDHPDFEALSRQPLAEKVRDVYRLLDDALGRVLERARDDDLVLFLSDHGFQSCTRALHMDRLLEHLGFLRFAASKAVFGPMQWGPMRTVARKVYDVLGLHGRISLPQSVTWQRTVAYTSVRSTGEGVSINVAGREPDGIVDPGDFEATVAAAGIREGEAGADDATGLAEDEALEVEEHLRGLGYLE